MRPFCRPQVWLPMMITAVVLGSSIDALARQDAGPSGAVVPRRSDFQYRPPVRTSGSPAPIGGSQQSSNGSSNLRPDGGTLRPAAVPTEPGRGSSLRNASSVGGTLPVLGAAAGQDSDGTSRPLDPGLLSVTGGLNDVAFLTPSVGIAVGDGGLIWRTQDGGRRWNRVKCDCEVDLNSVAFGDARTGWAVGGRALPIRGLHEGVVLRTQDGGVTWKRLGTAFLPKLTHVEYDAESRRVWALGIPDGQFATGLFESFDLGQNWNDIRVEPPGPLERSQPAMITASTRGHDSGNVMLTDPMLGNAFAEIEGQSALPVGDAWVASYQNHACRISNGRLVWAKNADSGELACGFKSVRKVGRDLIGVGTDGRLYRSADSGVSWKSALAPGTSPESWDGVASAGSTCWAWSNRQRRMIQYRSETDRWEQAELPRTMAVRSFNFLDSQVGWAVGPLGQVWGTQDGGGRWLRLHQTHSQLGVLVLAANAEDIPIELLTHLSVAQGLNVGVVVGQCRRPLHVFRDVCHQNEIASVHVDAEVLSPPDWESGTAAIEHYLLTLQPQVILTCPTKPRVGSAAAIDIGSWIEAIQQVERRGDPGAVRLIATLERDQPDSSVSAGSLIPSLGRLLGDVASPSQRLWNAWSEQREDGRSGQDLIFGVKRLVSLRQADMSWFQARPTARGEAEWIARRPVRARTSTRQVDTLQRMTQKSGWLYAMSTWEGTGQAARSQWRDALLQQQNTLPDDVYEIWLLDLVDACESQGRNDLATVARWELLQTTLHKPQGLAILMATVQSILSDEGQWRLREEEKRERAERFAALQREFAAEADEAMLTQDEIRSRALRRFGIDPETESQVPQEIIERILALDRVQREAVKTGKMQPDPEVARLAAVPGTKVEQEQFERQFQTKAGVLQRQTTILRWDSEPIPSAGAVSQFAGMANGTQNSSMTIVDQDEMSRLQMAKAFVRRAESFWPNLEGLPQWWVTKARIDRQLQDLPQTQLAWERVEQLWKNVAWTGTSSHAWRLPADLAGRQQMDLMIAETGDRVDLGTLDASHVRHTEVGTANPAAQAALYLAAERPAILPVAWTIERPVLDGHFDDPMWSQTPVIPGTVPGVTLRAANDETYLYLGISLPAGWVTESPSGRITPKVESSLARDAADGENALYLILDTDLDGFGSYQLLVQSNGQCADWQGQTHRWDPQWFVAQSKTQQSPSDPAPSDAAWSVEMAIDLLDLTENRQGKPWAWRLERRNGSQTEHLGSGWLQVKDIFQD